MKHEIVMPKAGLTNTEGVVSSWAFENGAQVKKGDVIGDIENEKSTIPLTSPADGFLAGLAEPGEEFKVGAVIGYVVDSASETVEAASLAAPAAEPVKEAVAPWPTSPALLWQALWAPGNAFLCQEDGGKEGIDYQDLPAQAPAALWWRLTSGKPWRKRRWRLRLPPLRQSPLPTGRSWPPPCAGPLPRTCRLPCRTPPRHPPRWSWMAALLAFKDSMKAMEEALSNRITLNEILSFIVVKWQPSTPA